MPIGKKIAAERRRAELSQEALAEQPGLSRQAVSRWGAGESMPDALRNKRNDGRNEGKNG